MTEVVVILILAAALGGAVSYLVCRYTIQPLSGVVRAHKFEVLGDDGKVSAIIGGVVIPPGAASRLGVSPGTGVLAFCDRSGNLRALLTFPSDSSSGAVLSVGSLAEGSAAVVEIGANSDGTARVLLLNGAREGVGEGWVRTSVSADGRPQIFIKDAEGFTMRLGSMETSNASTSGAGRTSAASIVMLGGDRDRHVIWKAP